MAKNNVTENANINIIYHGTQNPKEIEDIFDVVSAFKVNFFIVTGVKELGKLSELQRRAMRSGVNFTTFDKIEKAFDLINPEKLYIVDRKESNFDPESIAADMRMKNSVVFAFNIIPKKVKDKEKIGIGKNLSYDKILSIILYECENIFKHGAEKSRGAEQILTKGG